MIGQGKSVAAIDNRQPSFKLSNYLKTTYCAGGYTGPITVRTKYNTVAVANYNAILIIPPENALISVGWGYKPVTLTLSRLVAL